jgi:Tol biopolymer transport system component/C-terminal processing protease CtpA/Prc
MTQASMPPRPYLRTPALAPDGQRLAFVHAGDIWLVSTAGGNAERLTAHPDQHWAPCWSPDGQMLAFSSNRTGSGDLYVLPLNGGEVRRVTHHDYASSALCWSPDSQYIYFTSQREQLGIAIYRVSHQGGTPIPWLNQAYEHVDDLALAPDGERIAFSRVYDAWWRRGPNPFGGAEIWVGQHRPDVEQFQLISTIRGLDRWPLWRADGAGIFFVSDRSGCENIWLHYFDGSPDQQLTFFQDGRVLWPTIDAASTTLLFERDFAIWRLDLATGTCQPISITIRADTKHTPVEIQHYNRGVSELALSPDSKKVAFVIRGEVFADFADKETDKERRQGSSFRVTQTAARERDLAWTKDSRELVYVSDRFGDEEVFVYLFVERTEHRLTNRPGRKSSPLPAPDDRYVAYACGDHEIRLIDAQNGDDLAFVNANFISGTSFAWSPDGQWLVFIAQDDRHFSNLYLQRVGEQQARQITFLSNREADSPLWAPNGQFIVFTTGQYRSEAQIARVDLLPERPTFREDDFEKLFEAPKKNDSTVHEKPAAETSSTTDLQLGESATELTDERSPTPDPEPPTEPVPSASADERPADPKSETPATSKLEIVFAGIERRLRFLTPIQMDATGLCISPDSNNLVFAAAIANRMQLWSLPLDEARADRGPRQLTSNPGHKSAAQFSHDGKWLYYIENGQIVSQKFANGDANQLQISAEIIVDFYQEKLQVFDEVWRVLRDRFYDPSFRGLDWSAVRAQFLPLVLGAQTPGELASIMNLMMGELRASHLGAGFSSSGSWRSDGYLGVRFDVQTLLEQQRYQVAAVLDDSPAALAGIQVGEYLRAIDGVALEPQINIDTLLQRTVGRRVRLTIAAAQTEPEQIRDVFVRPIDDSDYDALQYQTWVRANETYVHRVSQGRLGYVHIREMSYDCYQQFLVDLNSETHSKEGVVIDLRFNGGGHIATFILDVLTRRNVLRSTFRGRYQADSWHHSGNRVLNKPTILVVNEHSSSNTEILVEGYRRLGLGLVVGRPTAGAVIGTSQHWLLNRMYVRVPAYRTETLEGEDLEGTGRSVDVEARLAPGEGTQNRDPQLDAAVNTLLQQLNEQPTTSDGA